MYCYQRICYADEKECLADDGCKPYIQELPMPHTTLLRLRTVLFTTIVTTALLFLPSHASAQPDLQIENFSVFSTLVESQGFRRVSISFTVVNQGFAVAEPSTTLVLVDNSAVNFATPQLASKAKAYISRGLRTSANELTISVVLDRAQQSEFRR